MDLNLSREKITLAKKVLDTEISHEETVEMIVPDVQPDIFRILDVDATALIRSKDTENGRVTVAGAAAVTVIYFPENEASACTVRLEVPFSVTAAVEGIDHDSKVAAKISVSAVDASIINTRKFVIRANFLTSVVCFNDEDLEICSGAEISEDMYIELLGDELEVTPYTQVMEKTFTIADELSLPGSKPDIEEILKTRVNLSVNDARLIGNKLVFKGKALIALLYTTARAEIESADLEAEFSQIMEIEDASEDCGFDIIAMLTGAYFNVNSLFAGEKRTVTMELHAVSQCIAYERKKISYIRDVYSTKFVLDETSSSIVIGNKEKRSVTGNNLRCVVNTQSGVAEIISVNIQVGVVSVTETDNTSVLKAPVNISCIYKCDDGRILSAKGVFEAEANSKFTGDERRLVTCECGNDVYASAAGGGIEIRVNADFVIMEHDSTVLNAISDISYSEDEIIDTSLIPSVTIARVKKDATFWKLAKKHHSTTALIMNANDIENESDLMECKMLIIPKKR